MDILGQVVAVEHLALVVQRVRRLDHASANEAQLVFGERLAILNELRELAHGLALVEHEERIGGLEATQLGGQRSREAVDHGETVQNLDLPRNAVFLSFFDHESFRLLSKRVLVSGDHVSGQKERAARQDGHLRLKPKAGSRHVGHRKLVEQPPLLEDCTLSLLPICIEKRLQGAELALEHPTRNEGRPDVGCRTNTRCSRLVVEQCTLAKIHVLLKRHDFAWLVVCNVLLDHLGHAARKDIHAVTRIALLEHVLALLEVHVLHRIEQLLQLVDAEGLEDFDLAHDYQQILRAPSRLYHPEGGAPQLPDDAV
eukprot:5032786-Prymnesium_polylepis.1